MSAGTHLLVTVTSDYARVAGTYPVKVVVEFNGKSVTSRAHIVIEHDNSQPFVLVSSASETVLCLLMNSRWRGWSRRCLRKRGRSRPCWNLRVAAQRL